MSGASGKVPAAIHLTPEAAADGPLARVRDGDVLTVDAVAGTLTLHVPDDELAARAATGRAPLTDSDDRDGTSSCSPACAQPSDPRTGAPAFSTPYLASKEQSMTPSLLNRVPSSPSSSSTTWRRRAARPRAGRRRGPGHRTDAAHAVALDAIEAIASEVPEICLGAGTIVDPCRPNRPPSGRPVPGLAG